MDPSNLWFNVVLPFENLLFSHLSCILIHGELLCSSFYKNMVKIAKCVTYNKVISILRDVLDM